MKIRPIYFLLILLMCSMTPAIIKAQGPFSPPPVTNDPPPPPPDPVDVPIDGGLSILIATGIGYGIKKTRDERKRRARKMK